MSTLLSVYILGAASRCPPSAPRGTSSRRCRCPRRARALVPRQVEHEARDGVGDGVGPGRQEEARVRLDLVGRELLAGLRVHGREDVMDVVFAPLLVRESGRNGIFLFLDALRDHRLAEIKVVLVVGDRLSTESR